MLTSSTGIRAAASSTTRWSMPSYRPHANTSRCSAAHVRAVACVNGLPAGVGTTSRGGRGSAATTASSASPHTCGRITMPGPPP